jgi:DNA-binding transcriptional ArsR family regulator
MMNIRSAVRAVPPDGEAGASGEDATDVRLDQVFAALSDPIRRRILQQLDGQALLVSELAAPFNISLQGVSRHIQVLVRAGLVQQERSGRISRCTLEAGPLLEAAVWLNRYAKYWQGQFDLLAATLAEIDERRPAEGDAPRLAEEATQTHTPQTQSPQTHSPQAQCPQAHSPKRNRSTRRK